MERIGYYPDKEPDAGLKELVEEGGFNLTIRVQDFAAIEMQFYICKITLEAQKNEYTLDRICRAFKKEIGN